MTCPWGQPKQTTTGSKFACSHRVKFWRTI